jgi:hypothetical protein
LAQALKNALTFSPSWFIYTFNFIVRFSSFSLSLSLALCLSLSICLSVCLSIYLTINLSVRPSVRPSVCLSIYHHLSLSLIQPQNICIGMLNPVIKSSKCTSAASLCHQELVSLTNLHNAQRCQHKVNGAKDAVLFY